MYQSDTIAEALAALDVADTWDAGRARDWWAVHNPDATLPELAQAS